MSTHEMLMDKLGITISIQGMDTTPDGLIVGKIKNRQQLMLDLEAKCITSSLVLALRVSDNEENDQTHKPVCLARWNGSRKNGNHAYIKMKANPKGIMIPPFNSFYIIEAQKEKAKVNLWQISIVHQNEKHFLRAQILHTFNVYKIPNPRKANKWVTYIADTKFLEYWIVFKKIVKQLFKAQHLPEYNNQDESIFIPPHDDLSNNQARIIWWNESRGLGQAITSDNQIYSVRLKDCLPWENPNDFITFNENQIIKFDGIKGTRLLNVLPS